MRCATPSKVCSACAIASSPIPAERAATVAATAFSRLCGPGMRGSAGSSSSRCELDSGRRARDRAESARHDRRVVGALMLEHPQLGVRVRIERAVAVEVIGLEVEEHADARLQRVHVLELKGRELADDPRVGRDVSDERRERPPDVACDLDGRVGRAKHRAEKLARGGLPVRPGHAQNRVVEQARAELDLAPHGDVALSGAFDQQRLARHSRALHNEIDPL